MSAAGIMLRFRLAMIHSEPKIRRRNFQRPWPVSFIGLSRVMQPMTRPTLKRLTTAAIFGFAAITNAHARPVVIELFTSQGCSSCPPADAYVGKLSARPDIIALSFHVNYWDDLGWRDRFALTEAVERQNVYARNLHRASVYTPQLIIDGSDDGGTNTRAVDSALSRDRDGVPVALALAGGELRVEVGTNTHFPPGEVILVAYLRHAVSAIGRGENAGRRLEEFNIVRSIRKLGPWRGDNERFSVPLSSLPADATDVAVLVQGTGQTPIVGAAARSLR
jgi:hypothetical protein